MPNEPRQFAVDEGARRNRSFRSFGSRAQDKLLGERLIR